ncbi:MAG TPA: ATP-binding cassette domain-containing protein [Candidatus Korarchaeota archaeon]|nr:ATP-binding cassette domain-containing protein [Candidatus Korarchaeota archaeon]
MNEKIAVVREIFKRYGKIQALRGLSFEVGREILGLVGPNGAGKTTTIRILMGLTKPDKGDVLVLGLNPWKDGHLLRIKTGVLHEKPQFPLLASLFWRE